MKEINRDILSLAIPSIITNITTPLLALMDVVIVGIWGVPTHIAAIAVGGTIFNMLYWLFAFSADVSTNGTYSPGQWRRRQQKLRPGACPRTDSSSLRVNS